MGEEVNTQSNDAYLSRLRLEKIGFVFQTFNLLATMTAYENVELPMKILNRLVLYPLDYRVIKKLSSE